MSNRKMDATLASWGLLGLHVNLPRGRVEILDEAKNIWKSAELSKAFHPLSFFMDFLNLQPYYVPSPYKINMCQQHILLLQ